MTIYLLSIMMTLAPSMPTPQTIEEAMAICARLQQEAKAQGFPSCTRARRGEFDLPHKRRFWSESPARMAIYFEGLAQICCGCHKVGTYTPFPKQTGRGLRRRLPRS